MKSIHSFILIVCILFFIFSEPASLVFASGPTPTPTKKPTPTPTKPPPTPTPVIKPTSKPTSAPQPTSPPAVINPLVSPAPQQSIVIKAATIIITKVKKVATQVSSFIMNNILPIRKPRKPQKKKKKTVIKAAAKNSKYFLPPPKKINKPAILNN